MRPHGRQMGPSAVIPELGTAPMSRDKDGVLVVQISKRVNVMETRYRG